MMTYSIHAQHDGIKPIFPAQSLRLANYFTLFLLLKNLIQASQDNNRIRNSLNWSRKLQ